MLIVEVCIGSVALARVVDAEVIVVITGRGPAPTVTGDNVPLLDGSVPVTFAVVFAIAVLTLLTGELEVLVAVGAVVTALVAVGIMLTSPPAFGTAALIVGAS